MLTRTLANANADRVSPRNTIHTTWDELQLGRFESDSFQRQTERIQSHNSTETHGVGGAAPGLHV